MSFKAEKEMDVASPCVGIFLNAWLMCLQGC
jgi:hypothetical protein